MKTTIAAALLIGLAGSATTIAAVPDQDPHRACGPTVDETTTPCVTTPPIPTHIDPVRLCGPTANHYDPLGCHDTPGVDP